VVLERLQPRLAELRRPEREEIELLHTITGPLPRARSTSGARPRDRYETGGRAPPTPTINAGKCTSDLVTFVVEKPVWARGAVPAAHARMVNRRAPSRSQETSW